MAKSSSYLTGITNSANDCGTTSKTDTKSTDGCTWTEGSDGKWTCVSDSSVFLKAAAFTSVASVAMTLY
jgi:hypothetical protein